MIHAVTQPLKAKAHGLKDKAMQGSMVDFYFLMVLLSQYPYLLKSLEFSYLFLSLDDVLILLVQCKQPTSFQMGQTI